MIVKTESSYKPITITFENKQEVALFYGMLDCPPRVPFRAYAEARGWADYEALHHKMWSQFRTIYKDSED